MLRVLCCVVMSVWLTAMAEAQTETGALLYRQTFDDFSFLDEDFVARSGLKTADDRGMTLEEGKFGRGLRMNKTFSMPTTHEMSGADLDMITGAMFRTGAKRKVWVTDNEPFLWGAGKINPLSGAVSFWVRGPLAKGLLFNQSAMRCGRPEQYLFSITVDDNLHIGAYLEDARYARHEIASTYVWDETKWHHIVFNWDRARGLELFVDGRSVASNWGQDAWWETPLPGLMHFPMQHVIYDEFSTYGRPLDKTEIAMLMTANTVPTSPVTPPRSTADRDRLAKAFGLESSTAMPVVRPIDGGRVFVYREVTPSFTGDFHIPDWFCRDGRYELAWPHPLAVFTPIPGDASYQAEKLEVAIPAGEKYNYVRIEGNLKGLTEALENPEKKGDRFVGKRAFSIPGDNRFFHGVMRERANHPDFIVPFLQGYGAPQHFTGNLHLPLTGDIRIQEIGLYDVGETEEPKIAGDQTYYLRNENGPLSYRYDFPSHALNPLEDQKTLYGYLTPGENEKWVETGLLTRINLMTAPVTGKRCFGGILLDMDITTATDNETLLFRLRDPGSPYRFWMIGEAHLQGFKNGGHLRLMLEPEPIIMAEGDMIWLDIATFDSMKIKMGTAKIILKPAPFFESEPRYEMKALRPALAECTKAHYQPWLFEKIWPDLENPHTYGGHFDSLVPAIVVKRVLPYSRIADQYIDLGNRPEGHLSELKKDDRPGVEKAAEKFDAPKDVPYWAWLQHKVQTFRYRVAEWIVWNQNPDGQLAEGWNDDVFMFTGKYDILLDGFNAARDAHLRLFKGFDETNILGDGYIQIAPLDSLHAWDFHSEWWQTVLTNLGDPYTVRRALKSAWYLNKPDKTPQQYNAGEPFMYTHNIMNWYWGLNARRSYTGIGKEQAVSTLERMLGQCDDIHFFRFTEAWNTMHNLDGETNLTGMIIGGWTQGIRNPHEQDRTISASWLEGGGEDLARWITYADSVSFTCRLFAFDPLPRKVTARLFRIDPGTYDITLTEDNDGIPGTVITSERKNLVRYGAVTVTVPSKKPVLLTVRRTGKASKNPPLPDLAVADYDCERIGGTLRVRLSNVGAAKAKPATVTVYDIAEVKIAEKMAPALDAPTDFVEKSAWIEFTGLSSTGALRVVVDIKDAIKELYEDNNETMVR